MSEEMRKKYPKPVWISEEKWIDYLKTIEEFGERLVDSLTQILNKSNKKTKKVNLDDKKLKLYSKEDDE